SATTSKVGQTRGQLTWTALHVGATPIHVIGLRGRQTGTAFRAQRWEDVLALCAVTKLYDRAKHLWDNLARLADNHGVTDEHAFTLDFALVMQRRHRHR